jgi:hypothetical protein
MIEGPHRRHLRNHLLFNDAFSTDLFEESTLLLVGIGAQYA